ncbi:FUSC family protein [Glutamicibacter sp. MNS18]|uniref:FUSC family protein n=1 Tax=Glutamicibacter sp. MNS18 TaxID=2989817 RepID=UPI0022354C71|nr:FUSC family protein [Glutamicibacter sp. MNS18]MCW4465830.1 FUSC family protein [Glutamicibacter sp. MNS18]
MKQSGPGGALKSLITLGPARKDHWVGLRTGIGIFAPLILLLAINRLDLMVFVVFGAFTGVYGRVDGYWNRLRMQLRSGALFFAVIALALLASHWWINHDDPELKSWQLVGATTLVAGACSVAAGFLRLRPAGSLFHIFAFAAIASIAEPAPAGQALLAAAATIVFQIVVGASGAIGQWANVWQRTALPPLSGNVKSAIWWEGLFYVLTAGAAGALANTVGSRLDAGHNYWAMVAAVVPLVGHTTRMRVRRGVHRVLGTLVGMLLMAALVLANPPVLVLVVCIGLLQFMTEMLVIRNYFLAQIFVTPLALIGVSLVSGLSTAVMYDRIVETLIGSAVGILGVIGGSLFGRLLLRIRGTRTA